jgi:hypothetical protein
MPGGCHLYIRIAILYIETASQQAGSPVFSQLAPPESSSGLLDIYKVSVYTVPEGLPAFPGVISI